MNSDLVEQSRILDDCIVSLYETTQGELEKINKDIEDLNELLQSKEMSVDRSENASFQLARDQRDIKVSIKGKLLKRIKAIDLGRQEYTHTGECKLGSTLEFTLLSVGGKKQDKLTFVRKLVPDELDSPELNLLAIGSAAGSAFLGKTEGEVVEITTIKGRIVYRIERIY